MKRYIATLLILFAVTTRAQQQEPIRLSLQECIAAALDRNYGYRASGLSVEEARTLEGSAVDLPQTSVTLVQTTTDGGGPDNGLKFAQEFDFPTVYIARSKQLKSETELSRRQHLSSRNDLLQEVYTVYYDLLLLQRLQEISLAQDSLYRRFCHVAEARYLQGEAGRLEWLNAKRLLSENSLAMEKGTADYSALSLRLANLLNIDNPVQPAESLLLPIEGFIPADSIDYHATPEGLVAEGRIEVARRNQSVARQGFMPSFTVGATSQLLIKGFNPYNVSRPRFDKGDFIGIEVGISVPLFFGAQRARAKAAGKALEAEQLRLEQQRSESNAQYQALYSQYAAALRALEYYRSTGFPEAEEMLRLSTVSYELGEIGYEEYARNLENVYAVSRAYAEAINTYNQTVIKLKHLQGTL